MATRHATGRFRRRSAMQPSNIGIAEGTNIRPVRYLILVQSALAAERAGGRSRQRMLLVPVIMSQRRGVLAQPSAVKVI
jgi:hypothetical protein